VFDTWDDDGLDLRYILDLDLDCIQSQKELGFFRLGKDILFECCLYIFDDASL
jgi:hypothetical protein